jgi:hypothetical protein
MTSSLQAFLAGILDYAGLFPPAQLPLDQAIRQYARYRHDPDHWMLGRFICPAARLDELTPFVRELFSSGPPLSVSALGRGGESTTEFLAGLRADLQAMSGYLHRHAGRVQITVYEVRVPADVLAAGSKDAGRRLLEESTQVLEQTGLSSLMTYYEAPREANWRSSVEALSTVLAQGRPAAGIKLRCGGLEATAFPSPEEVAITITACRDAGVPLKFTAGLHHPIRRPLTLPSPSAKGGEGRVRGHGFVNVFGAGVLAHARQLTEEGLQRILEDENAADFVFEAERFRWKHLDASVSEIRAARQAAVISFGSCSFAEPRDDLRALGLLNSGGSANRR